MTTWSTWSAAVASCVASVPDDLLKEAAEIILGSNLVLTAGNGGSAAIASHAAQAILKPNYRPGGGRPAVCLADSIPTLTAHANDGGWATALTEAARPFLAIPRTSLLLVSSSGRSENIVQLAELTRSRHPIITFTGFRGDPLHSLATVSIHVDSSDYEVVEPVHDALIHRIQYHLRRIGMQADS